MTRTLHGLMARATRRAVVGFAAAVLVAVSTTPAVAGVSSTADVTPRVNGTVFAIAQVGDLTIIGGDFTAVGGKPRLNAAAIRADGTLDPNFVPNPNGVVNAIAGSVDGSTVYLGGRFDTAGGAARANLAAVEAATGNAVAGWQADTTGTSPSVWSLTTYGERLYVGGPFSGIDGRSRASMVALNPSGDVVLSFLARANGPVRGISVSPDGAKVYVAGSFSRIGGADRRWGAAEILAANGDATAFNPVSQGGDRALAVGLSPDGSRVYFSTPNNYLFSYDPAANDPVWARKTSGDTQAIAVSATEVYIGGHFSQVVDFKIKRQFLASLNPADGTVTDWNPSPSGGTMGVWAITLTSTHVMVGGTFTTVNGVERVRFARFSGTP